MKRYPLLLFPLLLAACQGTNEVRPSGLMVEFIREPAGVPVMDLRPELSWIVPAEAGSQAAYQVLVASSEKLLRKDEGDIWDSGITAGNNSVSVETCLLKKNSRYFWKVRTVDGSGKFSAFSDIMEFVTGDSVNYLTTGNKFQTNLIAPVRFEKISGDHFFIDFGKDAFGTLSIKLKGGKSDTVILHLGEKLSGDRQIDRNPGGTIRYSRVVLPVVPGKKEYIVQLQKDKRNTGPAAVQLPDSTGVITPFRYCEVENYGSGLKPSDVKQVACHYYFDDDQSAFVSSDSVLNRVWELCRYTMKATSFAGLYVDGDRERIPYEADAFINQLGHYYTDREYSMARRTNEYFISHPTWPTEWILHTVPLFYYDFLFTGNDESIRQFYEALKAKTLVSLAGEDGLISSARITAEIMKQLGFQNENDRMRDIVDWPPSQKDTGWKLATPEGERDGYELVEVNTVVNAFYYNSLVKMAEISRFLGKTGDAAFYENEAARVKKSINEKLLDREKGIYVDGISSGHSSLHANMMPLAFGIVPEENRKTVTDFIKSRGMACSVYGSQYLLEGLYRSGEADYALSLMTSTSERSWWNMIRSGATIAMEAWDMKYKPNSDWNHAWGAAPANIIPGFMWGIAPAEPGYSKAQVRPQLGNLTGSSVTVPTIRGSIKASYENNGSAESYRVTIPGNMKCEFMLEKISNKPVRLNGIETVSSTGILTLSPGQNTIVF